MKQSLEARKIASLARQYEGEGYEVIVEPSASTIPGLDFTYRPDLIVRRGKEVILIEVVSGKSSKDKQRAIEFLSKYASEHEDMRFDLVVTNPRGTKDRKQNRDSILLRLLQERLGSELEVMMQLSPASSVIICSTLVESLLRGLASDESVPKNRHLSINDLARELRERSVISQSVMNFVAHLWRLRNFVLHNPAERVSRPQVLEIYEKTKSLLRNYRREPKQ